MARSLGVLICCFLFCSLCQWSTTTSASRSAAVARPITTKTLSLSLFSLLCCLMLFGLHPGLAFADDEVTELPDNYVQVQLMRSSPTDVVMIDDGVAELRSLSNTREVSINPAQTVFSELVKQWGNQATAAQVTNSIIFDLAWRYYNYPEKADKIPFKPARTYSSSGMYNKVYSLQECASYGDFLTKNKTDVLNGAFENYKLYELNHQSKSWDSTSPAAEMLYTEWYEYYEGTPSSGGNEPQGGYYTYALTNVFRNVNYGYAFKYNNVLYGWSHRTGYDVVDVADGCTASLSTSLLASYDSSVYDVCVIITNGTTWAANRPKIGIYVIPKGQYTYTFDQSTNELQLTINSGSRYYSGGSQLTQSLSGLSGSNPFQFTCASFNYSTGTGNGSMIQNTGTVYGYAYYIGPFSGSSSGGSSDPVPSPGIPETPTPSAPVVNNINAPTYNTNNYTTINQTDVDLQPVIDAISVLDDNMQLGFDGLYNMIYDWFNAIKQTMEEWRDNLFSYMATLYADTAEYLETIIWILYNLEIQVDTPYVPVPDVDTININYNNSVDRLSTKFPFSIPWDIKLILVLLEQPPQAPEFDLPVVMSDYTVHIDLSPFEPMAEISRFFSLLFFTAGLMMNTKKLVGF